MKRKSQKKIPLSFGVAIDYINIFYHTDTKEQAQKVFQKIRGKYPDVYFTYIGCIERIKYKDYEPVGRYYMSTITFPSHCLNKMFDIKV